MISALLLSLCLSSDPAEAAWQVVKTAPKELKADEKKKKFRHHWLNTAKKIEAYAAKYPKSAHANEALLLAAQTYEELAKISQNADDADAARKLYAKMPQSKKKTAVVAAP